MTEAQIPEILKNLPRRISDVVAPWAAQLPNQPALVEESGTWTYSQLAGAVDHARTWLAESGVRPGDRVMLVCENCRAFVAFFLAAASLDAWPVLVNARLSPQEIDQIRDHCGARRVIYTVSASPFAMKHAKRHNAGVREFLTAGSIAIGELNPGVLPEPLEQDPADNVGAMIYTSGTTALPKGVMLSHRSVLFMAEVSSRVRSVLPKDRLLGVLPMSHAVGLSVVLLGSLIHGATVYLSSRFDPVAVLRTMETAQLTLVLGAPSMFALLLEYSKMKGISSLKFPALRVISSSGAPLQATVKAEVENLFGMVLHNGYGITECSPTIALTRPEFPRKDLSVGLIFPGIEVQIVGAEGAPVQEGHVGELRVKGPTIMKGYYRAPEETAIAINRDGWFNTRDLARLDQGYLFIEGRTKDLIVRFGFNVYPAEVEGVMNTHPAVVRSAVIGRTVSSEGGEEIIAFVELATASKTTVEELAEHSAARLAAYKRPSQIFIVPAMPLTPTGKIIKDQLAKLLDHPAPAR
jgi:acyl-CoA synthetase (AMP-forming)/AMP-acid ligase II